MPGGSWPLKLISAGPRKHARSNWMGNGTLDILILQSALCQLTMSKCKLCCVSFKLKVVETAEKKSKEAAAKEFCVGPKRIPEYHTLILL